MASLCRDADPIGRACGPTGAPAAGPFRHDGDAAAAAHCLRDPSSAWTGLAVARTRAGISPATSAQVPRQARRKFRGGEGQRFGCNAGPVAARPNGAA
jgi:hypothetical protein